MIRAVEYYQIVCDEPGCTTSTAAWDDHWAALDRIYLRERYAARKAAAA